jgi:galactokinase
MDQSASILSSPGNVIYISFYPKLQPFPIPLPNSPDTPSAFVIANSLTVSNKAETGKSRYNLRVIETLAGARVLSRALGIKYEPEERLTYRQVLHKWAEKVGMEDSEENLKNEITVLINSGYLEHLQGKNTDGVTLEEMAKMCGMSDEEFHQVFLSWVEGALHLLRFHPLTRHPLSRGHPFPTLQESNARIYGSRSCLAIS